ncbi:MAG: amino acid adenylation domain-containing protein [Cellvibrio sp.]
MNASLKLPLLATQAGIWYADKFLEHPSAMLIAHCIKLPNQIDVDILMHAITLSMRQADMMNVTWGDDEGQPYQIIDTEQNLILSESSHFDNQVTIEYFDWSLRTQGVLQARQWMQQDVQTNVDLTSDKKHYRHAIFRLTENNQIIYYWYQRYHHVMLDGYSIHALSRYIVDLYTSLSNKTPLPDYPFTSIQTVIKEEQGYRESEKYRHDFNFWKNYHQDFSEPVSLFGLSTAKNTNSRNQTNRENIQLPRVESITLNPTAISQLQKYLASDDTHQLSLSDYLIALILGYQARLTDCFDQTVGIPFMRRMGSAALSCLAPVVNVLPIKFKFSPMMNWRAAAQLVRRSLQEVRRHDRFPAEEILRSLRHVHNIRQLYTSVVNYKLFDTPLIIDQTLAIVEPIATGPVDDIEFNLSIHADTIRLEIRANSELYSQSDVAQHLARISCLFERWVTNPLTNLCSLDIRHSHEIQKIEELSRGEEIRDSNQFLVVDALKNSANLSPQNIAVTSLGERLTYQELIQSVSKLSRFLISQGARKDRVVGVAIPRSLQTLVSIFAVLDTGATFLPIDLDAPQERLANIFDDAKPYIILTLTHCEIPTIDGHRINLDAPETRKLLESTASHPLLANERPCTITPDTPAYIIFTSGSTGRPKGVMNTHGALHNLYQAHAHAFYLPTIQKVFEQYEGRLVNAAHTHSFSFDSSWLQIFWLLHGQTLHIFDEDERRDAYGLVQQIRELKIDALDLPPSFLAQMLTSGLLDESGHIPSLALIGGEAAPVNLWQQFSHYKGITLVNLYGPTEYTVDTLRAFGHESETPVIGRPIANTRVHLLDSFLSPTPIGAIGELYISGSGLAAGYLGRADLTAARFVANPYATCGDDTRMYRTGDLVRWNNEGFIEYIGRCDDQVKIRGYRVEIGEVEAAIAQLPDVESVIVVAQAVQDTQRLLAYCVIPALNNAQRRLKSLELRETLSCQLPDYMVPSAFILLDEFPRNLSGKIDKKQLPLPDLRNQHQSFNYQNSVDNVNAHSETLTKSESLVIQAFASVLPLTQHLKVDDDFFYLGGDSISAIMVCTTLRRQGIAIKPSQIFKLKTARAIAADIDSQISSRTLAKDVNGQDISMTSKSDCATLQAQHSYFIDYAPALPLQAGMLFISHISDDSSHNQSSSQYHAITRIRFNGLLNENHIQSALNHLLILFPQLNGVFDTTSLSRPMLVIPDPKQYAQWPITKIDYRTNSQKSELENPAIQEDLFLNASLNPQSAGGCLAAALITHSEKDTELVLKIHHLLIDGWSTPLLLRALFMAYNNPHLMQRTIFDRDITARINTFTRVMRELNARNFQQDRKLWQEYLQGVEPSLIASGISHKSESREIVENGHSAELQEACINLGEPLSKQLTQLLRGWGVTLSVFMQRVMAQLLSPFCDAKEIVLGTPVSGRTANIEGIENQVGLFLNTIPVRVPLDATSSLRNQLDSLQKIYTSLVESDGLGLAEIQRLAGKGELFDCLLVVENYPDNDYLTSELSGADGKPVRVVDIFNRGYSHYPLALLVLPSEDIEFLVQSRVPELDPQLLASRLRNILNEIIQNPETAPISWPQLSEQEAQLIRSHNQTGRDLPNTTLRDLLRNQAYLTPHALALRDETTQLTYAEARYQIVTLAARLQDQGVKAGDIVAVALPRSVKLCLAILAVIEAGAAYLPLELSYPEDRLKFMLADSSPKALITAESEMDRFDVKTENIAISFDVLFNPREISQARHYYVPVTTTAEHPAYLIYTSGTTGRPKGVLVSHGAILNRILWMQHEYTLSEQDVVLQKTPCGFDVSVWEFFWPIVVGAQLFMAPPEAHRDPDLLVSIINQYKITTLHFVPSMLSMFVDHAKIISREVAQASHPITPSLKQVFCSGEALSRTLTNEFYRYFSAHLHNLYGPTEAAVDVTYFSAPRPSETPASGYPTFCGVGVPIGLPVWNTQVYVLDQYLREVPLMAEGELYLAGKQLATEYLGRPSLTANRFVANPFSNTGERMYRTGDKVRRLPCGNVEYLGRSDDQIKIRGQRIELGEIESTLLEFKSVRQAVVVAVDLGAQAKGKTSGDQRQLVAYLVTEPSDKIDHAQLLTFLKERLPAHMLPALFHNLPKLPLSANGKLNRAALPAVTRLMDLESSQETHRADKTLPTSHLERAVATLFEQLLDAKNVCREDDFFALGGHSLLAMQLAAAIRRELKLQIPVGQIMTAPSVEKIAAYLEQHNKTDASQQGFSPVMQLRNGEGTPLICFYPGSGFAWQYAALTPYLSGGYPVIGLQSPRPNGLIATSSSVEDLIDRQLQLLRDLQPHGPYYLLGYSLGGTIAYGIATRLLAMGEDVEFLGLLDTYPVEVHDWNDPAGAIAAQGAEREQTQVLDQAFGADGLKDESLDRERHQLTEQIFANYKDAVRLLSQAVTPHYSGKVDVFVAEQSLPNYIAPLTQWRHYVNEVELHSLNYASHETILSPQVLRQLGPHLDQVISAARNNTKNSGSALDVTNGIQNVQATA